MSAWIDLLASLTSIAANVLTVWTMVNMRRSDTDSARTYRAVKSEARRLRKEVQQFKALLHVSAREDARIERLPAAKRAEVKRSDAYVRRSESISASTRTIRSTIKQLEQTLDILDGQVDTTEVRTMIREIRTLELPAPEGGRLLLEPPRSDDGSAKK